MADAILKEDLIKPIRKDLKDAKKGKWKFVTRQIAIYFDHYHLHIDERTIEDHVNEFLHDLIDDMAESADFIDDDPSEDG